MTASTKKPLRGSRRAFRFGIEPVQDGTYRMAAVRFRRGRIEEYEDALVRPEDSREVLQQLGYRPGMPAVLALPRHDAILKWVQLPSSEPRQIAQMIRFEVRAMAPWPESETVFGHHLISTDSTGHALVAVVMARADAVQAHVAALHALNIRPTRVELTTFSLGRLFEGIGDDERPAIARRIGRSFEYSRYWSGHPMFSRGADAAEAPDLVAESLILDERKHGADQSCTLLVLATDADLSGAGDGARALPLTDFHPPVLNGVERLTPEAAACVGAALSTDRSASTDDLLAEHEQRRLKVRKVVAEGGRVVALGVICAILFYFASMALIRQERGHSRRARADIDALGANVGELKQKADQVRVLRDELSAVSMPLDVMLELYEKSPGSVGINFLHYNGSRPMVLAGEAPSFESVNQLLSALNGSSRFEQIKLTHMSRVLNARTDVVEFRMTIHVRGSAR